MNNNHSKFLTLKVTEDCLESGIVTDEGSVVLTDRTALKDRSPDHIFTQLQQSALHMIEKNNGIKGISSAAVELYAADNRVLTAENIAGSMLFKTGLNTRVDTSERALAYAEAVFGAGQKYTDFAVLNINRHLTGSLFINRRLYSGQGNAGNIPHITVYPQGRQCGCGSRGCLQTYISSAGWVTTAESFLLAENYESELNKKVKGYLDRLTLEHILEAAANNDKAALDILQEGADTLFYALKNISSLFDPQAVILTGSASRMDILVKAVVKSARGKKHNLNLLAAAGNSYGMQTTAAIAIIKQNPAPEESTASDV